jgi:hypothetical protein
MMTFVLYPRARYCHQVGGKFTLKLLELVVGWLAKDLCQCDIMGHLGLDRLGLIGTGKLAKGRCLVCPNDNCYESNDGGAHKSNV